MKKNVLVYITLIASAACLIAACSKAPANPSPEAEEHEDAVTAVITEDAEPADAVLSDTDPGMNREEPPAEDQEEIGTDAPAEEETKPGSKYIQASPDENSDDTQQEQKKDIPDIVWLGDSLTQGSLGDDNHNQNNPQAPWRVLGEISGLNVAGAGFYGYTTHDIFWAYGEYNGIKDPDITYIYWVGSNDFYQSPDNIGSVIEEIDNFNRNVGITDFLVLGTTNRHDMDPNAYIPINKTFEETYGDKYLDIMPYVEYGPDGIHLTESSYAAIARAVYDKLK